MRRSGGTAVALLSLLLLAAPSSPAIGSQEHQKPKHETRVTYAIPTETATITPTTKPSTTPTAPVTQGKPCTTSGKNGTKNQAHQWNDWYAAFGPSTWPNWALVIAAIIAAAIALCTLNTVASQVRVEVAGLRTNRRAANAAKKGADATEASLYPIRLAQRPWIVPTGDGYLGLKADRVVLPHEASENIPLRFDLRNCGNTPALKVTISLSYQISTLDKSMPESEDWTQKIMPIGIIGPGVTHRVPTWLPALDINIRQAIFNSVQRITICGLIQYRDHLTGSDDTTPPHATKFCLLWVADDNRFVTAGPYNDCT